MKAKWPECRYLCCLTGNMLMEQRSLFASCEGSSSDLCEHDGDETEHDLDKQKRRAEEQGADC